MEHTVFIILLGCPELTEALSDCFILCLRSETLEDLHSSRLLIAQATQLFLVNV